MNYKYLSAALGILSVALFISCIHIVADYERDIPETATNTNTAEENVSPSEQEIIPEQPRPSTNTIDNKIIPWKLVKGDVTDTCTAPTFAGQVTLKGRYVWDTSYVENMWLFEISSDQLKLLPLDQLKVGNVYKDKPQFYLANVAKETEDRLKTATDYEPTEITITEFSQYCEGAATLKAK